MNLEDFFHKNENFWRKIEDFKRAYFFYFLGFVSLLFSDVKN